MSLLDDLRDKCQAKNIELIVKANGHCQLRGQLLVNYYPLSKKQTAYIAGTIEGRQHVSLDAAIAMTYTEPPKATRKEKRKPSYKAARLRLLAKHPFCHWCSCDLNQETATLEHLIPLDKGGAE